jgi:hypothetical protein
MTVTVPIALLALSIWGYLILLRGGFWRCAEHDDRAPATAPEVWPTVAAIVSTTTVRTQRPTSRARPVIRAD